MRKLTIILAMAALAIPGFALAHAGQKHVMGTVTAVETTHVDVKSKAGKTTSVPLTADTKYLKGKKSATQADVTVGAKIMVDLSADGSAKEVKLSSGTTHSKMK